MQVSHRIRQSSHTSILFTQNEGAKNIQEQVEVMMSKMRQMCEEKQAEHTHISDTSRTSGDVSIAAYKRQICSRFMILCCFSQIYYISKYRHFAKTTFCTLKLFLHL